MAIFQKIFLLKLLIYSVTDASENPLMNHPAWDKIADFECGDSAADRIIGGVNAALGQFPWIARLGYTETDDDEIDWMCGGALVTDRHILTAAHCIPKSEDYTLTSIRLGEHDSTKDPDCQLNVCAPPVQDRKIKRIKSHAKFNNPSFHNDIAMIELDSPLDLNGYVAPICLPREEDQMSPPTIGELLMVAGWGKMNMTTEERATILQVVNVPVVTQETCNSLGKNFRAAKSEVCAGANLNKDACGGDSGGPLMKVFDTPDGPKNYLVGIVSFGPTICGVKKPGVYTSVPYFLKWILDSLLELAK